MKSVKTVVLWLKKKNSAKVVISEDCTAGRQSVESDSIVSAFVSFYLNRQNIRNRFR